MEKTPEVVARIREVGLRRRRDATGIDAAEEHPQSWREDVWDYRLRLLRARRARAAHGRRGAPRNARAALRLRAPAPGARGVARASRFAQCRPSRHSTLRNTP